MSKVRFVCLANSFKEGGRCVAGIILDNNNNPIRQNGCIQWIRPVCNTAHGEIPNRLALNINILDILEIEVLNFPNPNSYQSENALFVENSISKVGIFDRDNLNTLQNTNNLIFGNRGKAISEEDITALNHSLMLVATNDFEIYQKNYEDNPKPQTRIKFTYKKNQYDLPITDPVFLQNYQNNPHCTDNHSTIYLTLSIGVVYNGWYYKLVAGIILS
jgi:hypothetical protein